MYAESQSSEYSQHLKEKTIFNEHPVYAIYFLQNGIAQPDFHEHARSEGHDREIGFFFSFFLGCHWSSTVAGIATLDQLQSAKQNVSLLIRSILK